MNFDNLNLPPLLVRRDRGIAPSKYNPVAVYRERPIHITYDEPSYTPTKHTEQPGKKVLELFEIVEWAIFAPMIVMCFFVTIGIILGGIYFVFQLLAFSTWGIYATIAPILLFCLLFYALGRNSK